MSVIQLRRRRDGFSLLHHVAAVVAIGLGSACSSKKDAGPVSPVTPAAPTAQLTNAALAIAGFGSDGTLTLTAGPSTATVTLRSSNTGTATVSPAAVATGVTPGTVTITALSTVDSTVRRRRACGVRSADRFALEVGGEAEARSRTRRLRLNPGMA